MLKKSAQENPTFTVLVPTYNHGRLLMYALNSILQQTVQSFEVFVICDGAVDEGRKLAWQYAVKDHRIHVIDRPKGARHGEAYRHEALLAAKGKYVCYLGDDDLWFPDHLHLMGQALATSDFVHSRYVAVNNYNMDILRGSLENIEIRNRMLNDRFNIVSPTIAGHRLEVYRRLPEGWSPSPLDIWTDLNMWRKFIRLEGITFSTIPVVTALLLPSPFRANLTLQEREQEMVYWSVKIKSSTFGDTLQELFDQTTTLLFRRNDIEIMKSDIEYAEHEVSNNNILSEKYRYVKIRKNEVELRDLSFEMETARLNSEIAKRDVIIENYQATAERLSDEVSQRDSIIEHYKKDNENLLNWIEIAKNETLKRDNTVAYLQREIETLNDYINQIQREKG
ncbi:glycosyltransferase family 2 protein [Paenibacillus sp. YIM B09110]|uniref:glycosyltransferase family 2 protein n=1 Tax=Paenibacillus sp. YIM B09110 TaxID=3126102 RepID=UPI00301D08A3